MSNKKLDFDFLAVNKDFFKLKLNPIEILILSQIAEFERNTGDCFISDETLAESFGVSKSTISREIKVLEGKGFIKRETKNIKGGKERHMKVNFTNIKLSIDGCEKAHQEEAQTSNCLLTNVNLPIDNKQNDSIKEKGKEKIKENEMALLASDEAVNPLENTPEAEEVKEEPKVEEGTIKNPKVVKKEWLIERHNHLTTLANGLFMYNNQYFKMKE